MSPAADAHGERDRAHAIAAAAERHWAWIVAAIFVLLIAVMVFTGLRWASMPPSRVETIDPRTLHISGAFASFGLLAAGPARAGLVFNSEASFLAMLDRSYTEDYAALPVGLLPSPVVFTGNGFSYDIGGVRIVANAAVVPVAGGFAVDLERAPRARGRCRQSVLQPLQRRRRRRDRWILLQHDFRRLVRRWKRRSVFERRVSDQPVLTLRRHTLILRLHRLARNSTHLALSALGYRERDCRSRDGRERGPPGARAIGAGHHCAGRARGHDPFGSSPTGFSTQ